MTKPNLKILSSGPCLVSLRRREGRRVDVYIGAKDRSARVSVGGPNRDPLIYLTIFLAPNPSLLSLSFSLYLYQGERKRERYIIEAGSPFETSLDSRSNNRIIGAACDSAFIALLEANTIEKYNNFLDLLKDDESNSSNSIEHDLPRLTLSILPLPKAFKAEFWRNFASD